MQCYAYSFYKLQTLVYCSCIMTQALFIYTFKEDVIYAMAYSSVAYPFINFLIPSGEGWSVQVTHAELEASFLTVE